MKEDILEQLVDEYLQHKGYLTLHNVKFKPDKSHAKFDPKQDSVASDIDVIGFNPNLTGVERVVVVSCKSWQGGLDASATTKAIHEKKIISGRDAWRGFRELCEPKWAMAFINEIERITTTRQFTYWTAVTKLKGDVSREIWERHPPFLELLEGNPIKLITFAEMYTEVYTMLSTTPAASEFGRMVQLMKASGVHPVASLAPRAPIG